MVRLQAKIVELESFNNTIDTSIDTADCNLLQQTQEELLALKKALEDVTEELRWTIVDKDRLQDLSNKQQIELKRLKSGFQTDQIENLKPIVNGNEPSLQVARYIHKVNFTFDRINLHQRQ